jgi:hypothetical protein
MADEKHNLEIARADREAFVLCLALGTLEAMRGGAWPLEAGIWTLGRTAFWQPLVESDSGVVEVFQAADELSALAKLAGRPVAEEALDRMIAAVRSRLSALPEKSWKARWSGGDSG